MRDEGTDELVDEGDQGDIAMATVAMATVTIAAAGFIANVAGIENPTGAQKAWIARVVLILGTVVNLAGRMVLKVFMIASIVAEIVGSLGLGVWLVLFHQRNSLSVLFDGGTVAGSRRLYP